MFPKNFVVGAPFMGALRTFLRERRVQIITKIKDRRQEEAGCSWFNKMELLALRSRVKPGMARRSAKRKNITTQILPSRTPNLPSRSPNLLSRSPNLLSRP